MLAVEGFADQMPVEEGFADQMPAVEGFADQMPAVKGFADHMPVVEGFADEMPAAEGRGARDSFAVSKSGEVDRASSQVGGRGGGGGGGWGREAAAGVAGGVGGVAGDMLAAQEFADQMPAVDGFADQMPAVEGFADQMPDSTEAMRRVMGDALSREKQKVGRPVVLDVEATGLMACDDDPQVSARLQCMPRVHA